MSRGPEVRVDFSADGQDQVARAVAQLVAEIRRLGAEERSVAADSAALGSALDGFAGRALAFVGVAKGVALLKDAFVGAVAEGFRLNSVTETQELGIATLITAQTKLSDETGRVLGGQEALNAAYEISAQQLKKLQIAGLNTAAPTERLVEAYQTAIGSGLIAGLNLDEIRDVTVGITQAAGALGVPYEQLNQEVRSILEAQIDSNSRIGKAIGLTNEQIRQAREQGRLAEFLNEKFEAFGVAGERVRNTFSYLIEDYKESFSIFAAEATRPLFERIAEAGRGALDGVFDMETLEVSDRFQGLITIAQDVFGRMGDFAGGALQRAVEGAERLAGWLETNRDEIDRIAGATGDVVSAIGELSAELAGVVGATIEWGVQSGFIQETFETVADLIRFLRDSSGVIVGLVGAGGVALAVANPVAAISGAVAALTIGIHKLATAEDDARRSAERHTIARGQQAASAAELAREYRALDERLKDEKASHEEVERAKDRQKQVTERLTGIMPEYKRAIEQAIERNDDLAAAIDRVTAAEERRLQRELAGARANAQNARMRLEAFERENPNLKAQQDASLGGLRGSRFGPTIAVVQTVALAAKTREQRNLREEVTATTRTVESLEDALRAIEEPAAATPPTVEPRPRVPTDAELRKALQLLKAQGAEALAILKAELAERQRELDRSLEQNLVSYRDYYARLTELQLRAVDAEITERRRQLAATPDPAQQAQLRAELVGLQADRDRIQAENERKRIESEKRIADRVRDLRAKALEGEGQTGAARAIQLEREFGELRQRLLAEGDAAGVALIDRLINVEQAKANLTEIERSVSTAQSGLSRRLAQIRAEQEAGLLTEREAQREIALAYQEVADAIERALPGLQAFAALSKDPGAAENVERLQAELSRLQLSIRVAGDEWLRFRRAMLDALRGDLANWLTNGIDVAVASVRDERQRAMQQIQQDAERLDRVLEGQGLHVEDRIRAVREFTGEAVEGLRETRQEVEVLKAVFLSLAESVIDSMRQITAQMISDEAVDRLQSLLRGPRAAGGEAAEVAVAAAQLTAAGGAVGAGGAAVATGATTLSTAGTSVLAGAGAVTTSAAALSSSGTLLFSAAAALQTAAAALAAANVAGGAIGFSTGGYVAGPGTGTSDSIPARLSNGEFVIRAAVVRQYGPEYFASINRGMGAPALRRGIVQRYASGGLVRPPSEVAAPAAGGGSSELSVGLEDGLVLRHLRTRAGAKTIVQVIEQNPRAIRRALGLG